MFTKIIADITIVITLRGRTIVKELARPRVKLSVDDGECVLRRGATQKTTDTYN